MGRSSLANNILILEPEDNYEKAALKQLFYKKTQAKVNTDLSVCEDEERSMRVVITYEIRSDNTEPDQSGGDENGRKSVPEQPG